MTNWIGALFRKFGKSKAIDLRSALITRYGPQDFFTAAQVEATLAECGIPQDRLGIAYPSGYRILK